MLRTKLSHVNEGGVAAGAYKHKCCQKYGKYIAERINTVTWQAWQQDEEYVLKQFSGLGALDSFFLLFHLFFI